MDGFAQLLNESAHVVAAPVANVAESPASQPEELLVGNLLASHRIWVEIIIYMETVDVVAAHDIGCHTAGIVGCLLETWVQEHKVVIAEAEIRMLLHHAHRRYLTHRGGTMLGTVRINPGMNLHATAVTLLYHPLQGVPVWRRCLALHTRKILAPRFEVALVEGIALGSHLEDDGIHAILLQFVELV